MNKKWVRIALSILVLSVLVGFFWNRSTATLPEKTESAVPSATRVGSDVLRYPADAPQLSMIQSKSIQPSPMPLTDALSARLAYDEDVTARIGVGFSGRIVALKAASGNSVKAGQVLAEIDS